MSFIRELRRRNVIRVVLAYLVLAWLVLQVGDVLIDALELSGEYRKLIVILLALGFVPVVLFAWVYELTPDGIKREKDVRRDESVTSHTARKLDIAVIVLLVLAMGMFAYDRFATSVPDRSLAADRPLQGTDGRASIAVLPFVNMSGSEENEYFSDGLTETLLHMLAQVEDLRVAARTSAFAFKDTNKDIREIAAQLNVSTILEGSVQRSGQRVRITAQLVDAADGSHLWSENFDRDLDDIFAIQDEIANAVATALTRSLLGDEAVAQADAATPRIETVGTRSTEAYDHYLRGLGPLAEFSHGSLPQAESAFKEALLVDPGFREARLALAKTYLDMGDTALIPMRESAAQAEAAIAPLVESHASDPVVSAFSTYIEFANLREKRFVEDDQRIDYFGRIAASIARAPNEAALYEMAVDVLDEVDGREEERLAFVERGLEVDPLSGELHLLKGILLAFALERPEEALDAFAGLREIEPRNPHGYAFPGFVHARRGEHALSTRSFAEAAAIDRQDHELVAFVALNLLDMGLTEEAKPWLDRARLLNPEGGATQVTELLYLYLTGRKDAALALAKQVLQARRSNRRGVYSTASVIYALEHHERNQTDRTLALFETLAPGSTSDPGYWADDPYSLQLRATARWLLADDYTDADLSRWRETNMPKLDAVESDWREADEWAAVRYVYGLQDLDSAAAAHARAILDDSQYRQIDRLRYRFPALRELMAHPEVQKAVEAAAARYAEQAEVYRQMVAAGEIPGA